MLQKWNELDLLEKSEELPSITEVTVTDKDVKEIVISTSTEVFKVTGYSLKVFKQEIVYSDAQKSMLDLFIPRVPVPESFDEDLYGSKGEDC